MFATARTISRKPQSFLQASSLCNVMVCRREYITRQQQLPVEVSMRSRRHCRLFSTSSPKQPRSSDPTAKRPTKLCDPYGQGGKPLTRSEAEMFQITLHSDWTMELDEDNTDDEHDDDNDNNNNNKATNDNDDDDEQPLPSRLVREFQHADYLTAARFIHKMAAVAHLHHHFPPVLRLERRIVRKNWQTVTRIECRTTVLEGLSKRDFHLAMMMDVEVDRPEVRELIVVAEQEESL